MGKIEAASGGTLLIDEVDLLTLDDQAKLLRVVDTGEFERLGTVETSHANCRLIFASNVDLRRLVQQQRFRSDLYYRINVIDLLLPSLRDRNRDIPLLALDCIRDLAQEQQKSGLRVSLRMLWGCCAAHVGGQYPGTPQPIAPLYDARAQPTAFRARYGAG
jgi:DNA-binding NtrC family response regulator